MNIMLGIFVSILSAVLTAYLAFASFRNERLWEYKAKFYIQILESLYHIEKFFNFRYNEYLESEYHPDSTPDLNAQNYFFNEWLKEREEKINRELNDKDTQLHNEYLKDQNRIHLNEIDKLINISDFIIDRNATEQLIDLKSKWGKLEWSEEETETAFEREKALISSCIRKIKEIRKEDLESHSCLSRLLNLISKYCDRFCPLKT